MNLPRKRCLTLAALAHPYWNIRPSKYDIGYALKLALDMDLVRAQLLAEIVYRIKDFTLSSFDQINPDKQERITFTFGNRYSMLRDWILNYREEQPLPSIISCGASSVKCCHSPGLDSIATSTRRASPPV